MGEQMSRHALIAYLRLLGGTHAEAVQHDELPGDGDDRPTSRPAPDPDDDENDDFFDPQEDDDASRERP